MKLTGPTFSTGSIADAAAEAHDAREPIFWPFQLHVDDRGWSMMNLLRGVMSEQGQVNHSVQHPGVVKAWHRHQLQTDFWICVGGELKAGVYREEDDRAWAIVFGEHRPGIVIIPPTLWHGAATVGPAPASLLYYVTHAYNPSDPDEERRAWDSVPGFPWRVDHR